MESFDQNIVYKNHFLLPANVFVSKQPCLIDTLLGSCVAICMWDPVNKIGGMNHYMLPFWNGEGLASPKYGNIAVETLVERMLMAGATKRNIIAKVYGGAEVIDFTSHNYKIGERNLDLARTAMNENSITVAEHNVGGKQGRRIQMNTLTGNVLYRFITNSNIKK